MRLWINLFCGYAAVVLLLLLSCIFLLRLLAKKRPQGRLSACNKALRRAHIPLACALYGCALLHGLCSSRPLLSVNTGSACLLVALLMAVFFLLRKRLPGPWLRWHRWLCALCLALMVWHFIEAMPLRLISELRYLGAPVPTEVYADGTYRAEATGYRRHLWVEVTILHGRIHTIQVVEHYESGPHYYARPINELPAAMIAQQSCEVDVISGATLTSRGIIEATRLALIQANEAANAP